MKKMSLLLLAAALLLSRASAAEMLHASILAQTENLLVKASGVEVNASALARKKYLFVYFSAHWCPPCRAFTPKLVEFYNKNFGNNDFDLLFVSRDEDETGMARYMSETQMPWVGLKPGTEKNEALMRQFGVHGIPCLVLLDDKDQVLASSYKGGAYVGPEAALIQYRASHKFITGDNKNIAGAKTSTVTNTGDNRVIIGGKVVSSGTSGDNTITIGGKVSPSVNPGSNKILIGGK